MPILASISTQVLPIKSLHVFLHATSPHQARKPGFAAQNSVPWIQTSADRSDVNPSPHAFVCFRMSHKLSHLG